MMHIIERRKVNRHSDDLVAVPRWRSPLCG